MSDTNFFQCFYRHCRVCFCLWRNNYLFGIRYWNDPDVLKKLGEAMGMPVAGLPDQTASAEPEVAEEGEEEESIVHQTASLGDVEVRLLSTLLDVHMLDHVGYIIYLLLDELVGTGISSFFPYSILNLFYWINWLIQLGFEKCLGIWR